MDLLKNAFEIIRSRYMNPLQKNAEKILRVDSIEISNPQIQSIMGMSLWNIKNIFSILSSSSIFDNTKITLGKYLNDRIFLKYVANIYENQRRFYSEHQVGLTVQFLPALTMEVTNDFPFSNQFYFRQFFSLVFQEHINL